MKKAVVVGSGAGGAAIAKELQGAFDVTVLEEGGEFRRFSMSLERASLYKKAGLLLHEKEIQLLFPAMRIRKTHENMVLVRGRGTGGSTSLATGSALRLDDGLKKIGINLDVEYEGLNKEIPITTEHQAIWRPATQGLFEICRAMGLLPQPTPKMGRYSRCSGCGRCILGCPNGVKWDSRQFLRQAISRGARLILNHRAVKVSVENGLVKGVFSRHGMRTFFFPADLVILAAGGFGTPVILQNSGIACGPRLFVDPVLCVAARWNDARQNREIPMPFYIKRPGYLISPYFDHLSYFFNRSWKPPAEGILSLMIKLADSCSGFISAGGLRKPLTSQDKAGLAEAADLCGEIMTRFGVDKDQLFFGTLNAGHPGGMLPLTAETAGSFHSAALPPNLYVADATLLPASLGGPPILTIMAVAKRISKIILGSG